MLKKLDDRLFLIGVAHVLPKSADEVEEIITRERPEIVAVELCPARYLALTQGGKRPGPLDTLRAGPKLTILSALIYLLQDKFSRQTGMPAGEEMLVAVKRAREVGARVELIDRDIGLTLQRLIDCMPWRERFRLFGELLLGLLPFGKRVELEHLTEEQIVDYLLSELKRASPTAYEVLIRERDTYMASRLAMLLSGGSRVVCVVGAGHVPGIYERLRKGVSGSWGMSLRYRVGG
ncbi:MAG: TraB domain-containing protein [Hadesarchaea archaeon]|nr:TraB domain-containing protein [Hadesarchaea archaeon]